MDLFEKCGTFTLARDAIEAGIYPYFLPLDRQDGATAVYGGRRIIMCGSNNYLGLTGDARVREAARLALDEHGPSSTGSRLLNGNLRLHEELERELGDFFGKEAALVFTTGYHANLGVISALAGRRDVVIADREVHSSALDGCMLSQAAIRRFRHNDMDDLERELKSCPHGAGSLVVVDGVYSMGGDLCPLPDVVRLCREHGARLLVDDAHGAGVLAGGRGTGAHFGLTGEVDLIVITFSKAFASLGGAVMGSADVLHYVKHHARSLVFGAAAPATTLAAALAALRVIRDEPSRCDRAIENGRFVARALGDMGFDVGDTQTPIVPVLLPDLPATLASWNALLEAGVYTNCVMPPAASTRLRTSYMATHDRGQLDEVVRAFAALRGREESACAS